LSMLAGLRSTLSTRDEFGEKEKWGGPTPTRSESGDGQTKGVPLTHAQVQRKDDDAPSGV